jgi:hypothetical protein
MFRNSFLLFTIWTAPAVAQELPPGKARAIVIGKCGECHALDVVTGARGNKARWQVVVEAMVTNGLNRESRSTGLLRRSFDRHMIGSRRE